MSPRRISVWFTTAVTASLLAVIPAVASAGAASGDGASAPAASDADAGASAPPVSDAGAAPPASGPAPPAPGPVPAADPPAPPAGAPAAGPAPVGAAPPSPAIPFGPAATIPFGPAAGSALSWQNRAEVDNQRDRKNRYQVAFRVENGRGDQLTASNLAVAHADCTGCRTVALAVQIGILTSSMPSVSADNTSIAVNETCEACVTFAAAQQFLLVTDRPLQITRAGQARLAAIRTQLRRLAASRATAAQVQQGLAVLEGQVFEVLASQTRLAHRHAVLRLRQTVCDALGRRHSRTRVQPVS